MDIMSSPDPLNASLQMDSAPMSSRRVTRSQSIASSRLSSVNPSPRKQTFALDVGNERSPQKILVTVEADDRDEHSSRARRKLFESPTPKRTVRRRVTATTTVVPLKGLTDDENDGPSNPVAPTPKRRGRPPKSAAGTPAATTTRKKATPIRKTPGRPRKTKATQSEDLTSDISVPDPDATPKPTRTRTATKRKNGTPAKEAGETPKPKRRGRPRRVSITASEVEVAATQPDPANAEINDNASVATAADHISVAGSFASAPPSSHGGDDDDIWMNTLSDPPAQASRRESSVAEEGPVGAPEEDLPRLPYVDQQTETDGGSEANYDYGATGGHSDTGSVASEARGSSIEKDTIMVQEEFTMISINSLPSMQGRLSLAANREEIGDETSLIINNTLESLRQSRNEPRRRTPFEDEVSFVGPSPEKPSSPLPMHNNSLLSQPAPTPVLRSSPRKARGAQDLARQLALKSLQKQQEPESAQREPVETGPQVEAADEQSLYDDSFSEIPEAVLEAATPKPMRRAMVESSHYDSFSEIPEEILDAATPRPLREPTTRDQEDAERSIQQSVERPARINPSPNPQSESTRLLTPDETPSPVLSELDESKAPESAMTEQQSEWEMHSSPPVVEVSQQVSQSSNVRPSRRRNSSETPALQAAAPSSRSPPRMEAANPVAQNLAASESATRPTLSPIVRAGRALQMVTTDPPSPTARSPSLGSPFRVSLAKSPAPSSTAAVQPASTPQQQAPTKQSSDLVPQPTPAAMTAQTLQAPAVAPEEQRNSPWSSAFAPFKQIRDLVVQGAQRFSPRAAASPAPAEEDPFVDHVVKNSTQERQDTLSMHNSMFSLGGASTDRPASRTSSVQAEVAYEDEMSWQAEEETPAPRMHERSESVSSTMRGRRGSEVEMSDADMESLVEESFMEQDEEEDAEQHEDAFDDDIWAVEAQRPSPGRPQAKIAESEEPVLNPPRRSKLPSPWRRNSKRLVYNDELHKMATDPIDKADEVSLLSQFSGKEAQGVAPQPVQAPKKVDLSAFFSSPALLPEILPPGMSYPKPSQRAPPAREPATRPLLSSGLRNQPQRQARGEPESQPSRGTPSVARSLFSFGRRTSEAQSNLAVAPSLPSVPQKDLQIGSQRRVDLFSPVKPTSREEEPEPMHQRSSSPSTPPRQQLFAHTPQKRNFTPRSGQTVSLFAPSPATRQQPAAIASVEEGEDYSEEEEEDITEDTPSPVRRLHTSSSPNQDQDSSFVAPVLLKPLPSRQQSPTKSCIRSPLKPKTPGRVVEFTSSTLSPLAQAQARAEQRASSAAGSSPAKAVVFEANKENRPNAIPREMDMSNHPPPSRSSFSLSTTTSIPHLPPRPAQGTSLQPATHNTPRLSPSIWSRAHWERLDALLQQRRRSGGSLAFQLAHPVTKTHQSAKLLGKEVVAQGEKMRLERWHLDVVDAFAAELGPGGVWDERVLAKRVFALLVGEERRRAGRVDRGARVVV